MKKQAILFLMFLLVIPMFYAYQESLGIVKQNEPANLIQTCYGATSGNITRVVYPDKTFAINEELAMTKNGDNFNYSFLNTSQLGQYLVYGICDATVWQYDFEVTPSGGELQTSQSLIFVIFFVFVLGILIFSINGLSNSHEVSWQIFYICLTYLTVFSVSFVSWLFSRNYLYDTPIISSIFWIAWLILAIMFWPFIIGVSGYLLKLQAEQLMISDYEKQGFSKEEAKELSKSRKRK